MALAYLWRIMALTSPSEYAPWHLFVVDHKAQESSTTDARETVERLAVQFGSGKA